MENSQWLNSEKTETNANSKKQLVEAIKKRARL